MIIESVNSLERLPGALRQLGSIPKLLCSEEEFIKTEHIQKAIILFREKVIALFDEKLTIYNNQFNIDGELVSSNIAFFNIPIEKDIDKTTRPKYIITDGGNYVNSQNKRTRLRCGGIILDESFKLSAFFLSSGKTNIQSHIVHEQYALIDALCCLDYIYKSYRSEQLIWISDLSHSHAQEFFDENKIEKIDFISKNSLTKNFAYSVFIKGIIDKLLHKEHLFNKISSATFKKPNVINNYIVKEKKTMTEIEDTPKDTIIPQDLKITETDTNDTISLKNIPVIFVEDFNHTGSLHINNIGNMHQSLFRGLSVTNEVIVENCSNLVQLSSTTITAHTLILNNLENLEIIAQTVNVDTLIVNKCPKLILKDVINLYPNIQHFKITR